MNTRRANHRRVKLHRTYTVGEAASLLGKHKNTIRGWIEEGLPTIDRKRPTLIRGRDLIEFLLARRRRKRQTCLPGQMYCVRCRAPKFPPPDMVEFGPITEKIGNLRGICPDCTTMMNRRVSLRRIDEIRGDMQITFPQALERFKGD